MDRPPVDVDPLPVPPSSIRRAKSRKRPGTAQQEQALPNEKGAVLLEGEEVGGREG